MKYVILSLARSCPALSSFDNGKLDPANPATTVGSKVRFECNVGYILKGPSTRICLADDSWSGIASQCDGEAYDEMKMLFVFTNRATLDERSS